MAVSFLLCLLPALLATAGAEEITCVRCHGSLADCYFSKNTCSVDTDIGGCISVAEVNTAGGTPVTGYFKDCLPDFITGIKDPISFTVGVNLYLRANIMRCKSRNCNSLPLELLHENSALNGRQCPACLAFGAQTCTGQIIRCTGEETYCGDFAGTLWRGSSGVSMFAAQGCITPSAREIHVGKGLISGDHIFFFTKASVKPADRVHSHRAQLPPPASA